MMKEKYTFRHAIFIHMYIIFHFVMQCKKMQSRGVARILEKNNYVKKK